MHRARRSRRLVIRGSKEGGGVFQLVPHYRRNSMPEQQDWPVPAKMDSFERLRRQLLQGRHGHHSPQLSGAFALYTAKYSPLARAFHLSQQCERARGGLATSFSGLGVSKASSRPQNSPFSCRRAGMGVQGGYEMRVRIFGLRRIAVVERYAARSLGGQGASFYPRVAQARRCQVFAPRSKLFGQRMA